MDEASPLGVYLVKSGSKGDRLLFRYPYAVDTESDSHANRKRTNPYSLTVNEDTLNITRARSCSEISDKNLVLISDKALSNLFATKSELCNRKFELKVNDVRFVGHPVQLCSKRETSTFLMFNVVFALKAYASHDIVNFYHDFTHKIAIALSSEENRCNYLSYELKSMLRAHDDTVAMPEGASLAKRLFRHLPVCPIYHVPRDKDSGESPYYLILKRSQLARDLQRAYNELHSSGSVQLHINRWINVSFCLPHKVHRLHLARSCVKAEAIQKCLTQLRPYHSLLLLVDPRELVESLPTDASSALVRLIHTASPMRSLVQLAADTDLTLRQVFQLSAHLVYWAKATIIYPLCESNCYVLAPNAPTNLKSPVHERFAEMFPGVSLPAFMSKFSLPTSLSQLNDPMDLKNERKQLLQILVWMLQERILMQLHTYVYLVPTEQPTNGYLGSRPYLSEPHLGHRPATSQSDFSGSVPSEDSMIGSPSQSSQSSKCGSDEDLSPAESDGRFALSWDEKEAVARVPAYRNLEDRKLFLRLCPRFKGKDHLEEIMYYENVRRSHLLALLDKFREVLFTVQHEDPTIAVFYS
ncbi:GATOR complex protein NPRL3 isoform X2 [Dermacentor silvarum]|uniref:GATOR complex protein NPRL3 isoform X2 n=1 Tax=Dermacentor silvarum TaxID=543639 RepID=UPI00189B1B7C|nr:GATOR complex protein NPRL3 isoform X2 [Dermacentor silvarum]